MHDPHRDDPLKSFLIGCHKISHCLKPPDNVEGYIVDGQSVSVGNLEEHLKNHNAESFDVVLRN